MSGDQDDILPPGEVEFYINCLEPNKLENIGSLQWFGFHHRLTKLNQQSTIEAKQLREETVKEHFISHGKVPLLIHEAVTIQVWREKVFKELLKIDKQTPNTFIAYIIMYHELTAVGLLQNILFHKDAIETLEDFSLDLVDYCAAEIVRLLAEDSRSEEEKSGSELSSLEELKKQSQTIGLNISLSCICIIGYMAQCLEALPLSAVNRMYCTHDVPVLIASLLQRQPWKRTDSKTKQIEVYDDGSWRSNSKMSGVSKYEGQCWIALRTFLLSQNWTGNYEINDFRKQHFLKVQRYLHETVIDQISPLIELKQWLLRLQVSDAPTSTKKVLLMETIPEIKTKILEEGFRKWKKITKSLIDIICDPNKEIALQIAKTLGETYNIDHLDKVIDDGQICPGCGEPGVKRCSKCKCEWYCGRECQVQCWPKHKAVCSLMSGDGDK